MFSKKYKEIINQFILSLSNTKNKILLDDYISLHTVLMAMYARNVFRFNSNWNQLKPSYRVNYTYIRENNTSFRFTEIEKEIKKYLNLFIDDKSNIEKYSNEFIDYIRYCMKTCIKDLVVPFKIMSPKIRQIIDQYKKDEYIMKFEQKSKKLNYDVLAQLSFVC